MAESEIRLDCQRGIVKIWGFLTIPAALEIVMTVVTSERRMDDGVSDERFCGYERMK